ncbi:hypothetical protein G6L63_23330 [Agrobacterium vitis]|uniref:Immunity protein 45 domain-containing protein n=1 Tax=Agrobacterium vitis TaxID=373 RepID=A0A368NXA8_AGRVI|nr:Imm45 family immunity protein [Agrobacterium vitis]KAA3502104.1 hypothetical protein DXM22_25875 [Agrobacterium vitis]KAA3519324.1 hypothetical protein DXT89_26065 [Agrobacterium vitis]MCF1480349.1 hypothetical protein [Agrobacterium vitis]MUZ99718.1 hypothetical protein [Agrobacterium vitis]MVA32497.1 hypothetical protein [Agrobacterium vitis]
MQKLIELNFEAIARGAIFRVRGQYPYENVVDFMVVETSVSERPLGIMVATGYSAGHTFVRPPPEAILTGTKMLSTAWLKENWAEWIYPACPVGEVFFLEHYPAPEL